ncbi:leucyl aminopeptidase [Paenibacillus sp. NPDC058910]|uniref:leucyl aminopeptidase n=1 Tax=unclassified Paenibacillus TaxID=185978 RepID=UPI0036882CEF
MKWTLQGSLSSGQVHTDAIIIPVTKKQTAEGGVSEAWDPLLKPLAESRLFDGTPNRSFVWPESIDGESRLLIWLGRPEGILTSEQLRLLAAQAGKAAVKSGVRSAAIQIPNTMVNFTAEQTPQDAAQALTEGFILGSYWKPHYKRDAAEQTNLEEILYYIEEVMDAEFEAGWTKGMSLGAAIGEATCLARDLTNLPGNMLLPEDLAQKALQVAKRNGFEAQVLDEEGLVEKGMGGLLAVGKGSIHPPRMIALRYQGRETWEDVIGLVGKGVTFDTGGVSLKRASGMEDMISDMGGAATVLGVMEALGRIRPRVNVVMVIPSAENVMSGSAFKPGDIVTTLSGRTIEVLNTDAEGRIVLADGVTYAKQLGASRLIDVATLTGAVVSALGDIATGAVTNDETFLQELITSSRRAGEKIWPLPSYPEFWDKLKSEVADLRNQTGREGGTITGGLFVGTFADGLPWVHFDIAGTAYLSKERGVDPKGATGVLVRTITDWILKQVQVVMD